MIGTPLCEHIARYYPSVVGEPIYFWEVPIDQVPVETRIVAKPSNTGDTCHRELRGLKDSKEFFRNQRNLRSGRFRECRDGVPVDYGST
jgi:hypothetical protein